MTKDAVISRKQQLIAQAALHRRQLQQAQQAIASGLQPSTLVKGAAGGLALTALTLLKNKTSASKAPAAGAAGAAALLPLALRGVSLLSKATARKPRMRKALIAAAVGALAAFAAKKALQHWTLRRRK